MKFLAKNFAFLRKKLNKSQAEISVQQGFNRSTWNNYEKGKSKPGLDDFIRLSKYFDIDEGVLLHVDIGRHNDLILPNRQNAGYVKTTNPGMDAPHISSVSDTEAEYISITGLKLKKLESEIELKNQVIAGKDAIIEALSGQVEALKEARELLRQQLKSR